MAPAKNRSKLASAALVLAVALALAAASAWKLRSGIAQTRPAAYEIAPEPGWVRELPGGTATATADAEASGGTANLLVDRQIRIQDGWSEYDRYVTRVVNPAGIDDASQITINFDPELARLHVHAVTLRRGAESIDELKSGRIELLQRESHLEQSMLDGSLTFHLVMSDVRVGDLIDCRYTIDHRDPAWGNRFFGRILVRWDDPVQRSRLRVLVPARAPLYFRAGAAGEPVEQRSGAWESLEWNWSGLRGIAPEPGAPSWYVQYPEIQFSQFADWSEVRAAELPLYAVRDAQGPELTSVIARLRAGSAAGSGRALAALRFVQEEIRYTGLELGAGAYRPTPPDEVLRRRYGDCKDKALLAVTLLRALGIDADPALVSARWMRHLDERLASPAVFDHAIVRVRLGGRTYWFDPTLTAQGGRLETLSQADFGEALVVAPGVSRPEPIPSVEPQQPLVDERALLDLRAGLDRQAQLRVSTVYRGAAADDLRRRLRRSSPAQLGIQYLDYYRTLYPAISSAGAPQVRDDFSANEITVDESYRLAHPFETSRRGESHLALEADLIGEYLTAPDRTVRMTPLSLHRHVDVAERITIRQPRPLAIDRGGATIDAPAFRYESRISREGNELTVRFRYRSLADGVSTDELADFLRDLDAARENAHMMLISSPARSAWKGKRT